MCVDDYQFRHSSAKRQKICKRFIFHNEEGQQRVFLINISQFQRNGQLCLCQILLHLVKKGLQIKDHSFYMPQLNITIEAGDRCKIPFDILTFKQVLFQMKNLQNVQKTQTYDAIYDDKEQSITKKIPKIDQNNQQCDECKSWSCASKQNKIQTKSLQKQQIQMLQQEKDSKQDKQLQEYSNSNQNIKIKGQANNENGIKKHKEQEKTVEEALYITKCWRLLHENCHFSLKNAANLVELSKKTLDDYFLVLRVAEYHGYNFEGNLSKKIGHLRAFIRNQPIKVTGRLPKQIKSFNLVPNPQLGNFIPIKDFSKVQFISQQNINNTIGINQGSNSQQNLNNNQMIPQ